MPASQTRSSLMLLSDGRVPPLLLGLAAVAVAAAALLGAAYFEHVRGLEPCALCFWQRYAHWAALGLGLAAVALAAAGRQRAARWLAGFAALAFLAGAGISGFHVGVEQGWWEGLPGCQIPAMRAGMSVEELARVLEARERVVPCDAVAWSLFGISMAGYNFLLSLAAGVGIGLLAIAAKEETR